MSGPEAAAGEPLWGVLSAAKRVALDRLDLLRADEPVWAPEAVATLIEDNPWLAVLDRLGYRTTVDPRMVPVEEGESSLNANPHQALAALLVLVEGASRGLAPTVVGDLTLGNHALAHSLDRFAEATPDPAGCRRAFHQALGPPALAAAEELLARRGRPAAKAFGRLPPALQTARALRLPATLIAAPAAGRVAALAAAAGLDPELAAELAAIREAMDGVGLTTFGDLLIVARSAWLRRAAAMLDLPSVVHLPVSFERLVTRATPEGFASRSLGELAAAYHAHLAGAADAGRARRGSPYAAGRYRLLNLFDPVELLIRGAEPEGGRRRRDPGWEVLEAGYETGAPSRKPAAGGGAKGLTESEDLATLPLTDLFARGYGLSGKLIYMATREVNHGRLCVQAFRAPSDVYLGLADPAHPVRALPLARVYPRLAWGRTDRADPTGRVSPDFGVFLSWLRRRPDPPAALRRLYEAFRQASDPGEPDGRLWIDEGGPAADGIEVTWVPPEAEAV